MPNGRIVQYIRILDVLEGIIFLSALQAIFQRCFGHHAIRRKWENGEYSNVNSSQAIPERSMTDLTQDEWGKIFNLELVRGN